MCLHFFEGEQSNLQLSNIRIPVMMLYLFKRNNPRKKKETTSIKLRKIDTAKYALNTEGFLHTCKHTGR